MLILFNAAATLLFHIVKRKLTKVLYFSKIYTHTPLQVAQVSLPSPKFARPPCWYYRLQKLKSTSIPNLNEISPTVIELNRAYGQTDRQGLPCMLSFHARRAEIL
jgi:hypothetical protein